MVNWKARILLICIAVSALSSSAVVVSEALTQDDTIARRNEFQSLVHGLGFGPAVDLSHCSFSFDPRLAGACSQQTGPIPGGSFLCPMHTNCATGYPHLLPARHTETEARGHAASR